jgi:hypothetical protein
MARFASAELYARAVFWRRLAVCRVRRQGRFSREVVRQARHSAPPAVWARLVALPSAGPGGSLRVECEERAPQAVLGAAEGPQQAVRVAVAALQQVVLAAGAVLRDAAVLLREARVEQLAVRLWEVLPLAVLPSAAPSRDLVRPAPAPQRSELFVHAMPSLRIASPSKPLSRAARDEVLS